MPESEPFYGGPHFVRHDFEGTSRDLRFIRYSHLARHMHLDRVKTGEEIGSLFLLYLFPPFRPLFPIPSRAHRTRFVVQFRCGVSERGEQKFSPGALTLYIRRDDDE